MALDKYGQVGGELIVIYQTEELRANAPPTLREHRANSIVVPPSSDRLQDFYDEIVSKLNTPTSDN